MTVEDFVTYIFILALGFVLGVLFISPLVADDTARHCFDGTLATTDEGYVINTETGKFY